MKMKNYVLAAMALTAGLQMNTYAQPSPYTGPQRSQIDIIPPSPEAAALGRYGDVPVGYYNGSVSTSVPLAEIKAGKISLPVSLDYNSNGGIKVGEPANNAGLGWSISASNVITRSVMSHPDEQHGFLTYTTATQMTPGYLEPIINGSESDRQLQLQACTRVAAGCLDMQPDIFYYNFGGYTGKFFFNWEGKIVNMANNGLKITYTLGSSTFARWVVITENGIKYTFEDFERTIAVKPKVNGTYPDPNQVCSPDEDFSSSWYLSQIEDQSGNNIKFGYQLYTCQSSSFYNQAVTIVTDNTGGLTNTECSPPGWAPPHLGIQGGGPTAPLLLTTYFQLRLSTVKSSDGSELQFAYNTNRTDHDGYLSVDAFKSLDNIYLKYNGTVRKQWDLAHNYSTGRLTLTQLTEKGENGQPDKAHRFEYNEPIPASIYSFATDHWGYYNGQTTNTTAVPSFVEHIETVGVMPAQIQILSIPFNGANRDVDTQNTINGLLKKIIYPTGGSSEFEYEAHRCSRVQSATTTSLGLYPKKWASLSASANGIDPGTVWQQNTGTFTLNSKAYVKIYYSAHLVPSSSIGNMSDRPSMYVAKIGNGAFNIIKQKQFNYTQAGETPTSGDFNDEDFILMEPGTYEYGAKAKQYDLQNNDYDQATISLIYQYNDSTANISVLPVGGARIKKIKTTDNYSNVTSEKLFSYIMPDSANVSSGVIYDFPKYRYQNKSYYSYLCGATQETPGFLRVIRSLDQTIYAARNVNQMGATSGSHIGYEWVTVTEPGSGKKAYHYTTPAQYSDFVDDVFPFTPPTTLSYKTGLLLEEKNYSGSNNSFTLVNSKANTYNFVDTSLRVPCVFFAAEGDDLIHIPKFTDDWYSIFRSNVFSFDSYYLNDGYPRLTSTSETNYLPSAVTTINSKTYHPIRKQFMTTESVSNSDGKTTRTDYSYPFDEASSPVITAMLDKNMIAVPTTIKSFVNNSLVSTTKNTFSLQGSNQVELYKKETSTFNNPLETEITYDKYDAKGHLLRYTLRGGNSGAILWGYDNSYPVAELQNINANALDAYLSSNPSVQAVLNTPSNDQALHNAIQQLRAAFPEARVTGYAYQPLIGMTSKSDINNTMTWFEYDAMGRLARIKDQNGNILKQNSYQYQVTE